VEVKGPVLIKMDDSCGWEDEREKQQRKADLKKHKKVDEHKAKKKRQGKGKGAH